MEMENKIVLENEIKNVALQTEKLAALKYIVSQIDLNKNQQLTRDMLKDLIFETEKLLITDF